MALPPAGSLDSLWHSPPPDLTLERDEVHVWRVIFDTAASRLSEFRRVLSADERERSDRFYFQRDRDAFAITRGLLRVLLGRYLGIDPRELRFSYSRYGKPALAFLPGAENMDFNVSHSHGLALLAMAHRRKIGIDVERVQEDFVWQDLAKRFFSPLENAMLAAVPEALRYQAFFACWTRKEAYIKARGEGLSMPLDQFDVTLIPGEPARLLATRAAPQDAARWSLQELLPDPQYAGALAVEGSGGRLCCWQWPAGQAL